VGTRAQALADRARVLDNGLRDTTCLGL